MSGLGAAPLLLLPGLLCDAEIWPLESLLKAQPAIVTADYGLASSMEAMADAVLLAAPQRFSLLGHSMGARVAFEIFRRAPERVQRLALVSTGVHQVRPGEAEARHALLALGRTEGAAALVDQWLPPMVAADRRADATLTVPLRTMCIRAGVAKFEAQIAALLNRPEVESLLPGVACPALVLVGSEDQWSPPAQHRAIADAIPGAEMVVVGGAGHMLPAEAPEAFVAAVVAWLARDPTPLRAAEPNPPETRNERGNP